MAVGDSITVGWDGTNIEQRVYANNTSYMDEWYIRNPYYATVNIYYDMGYCVQFDETKEEAESSIRKYMRKVAGIFEEEFGLHIDYTITFYNSPIDQCKGEVTKDNINRLCTHGADHTNKENMKNSFKASYPGSDTVITLYWTGHALSLESGKGNGNVSCSSDYSLFLLGNKVPEEDRERRSYRGLLHELCHQFSVKDHYHTEENDTKDADGKVVIGKCKNEKYGCSTCADDGRDRNCVIGEETADNKALLWICDDCSNEIIAHLKDHHGEGVQQ